MYTPIRHVKIEIDDLADLVFIKNKTNTKIELELGGIKNNKDLFCFIIDLLCKGLILLYGVNNKVELDDMTMEDFIHISAKLKATGINVYLKTFDNTNALLPGINLGTEFDELPDDLQLSEYTFTITSSKRVYSLSFTLTH